MLRTQRASNWLAVMPLYLTGCATVPKETGYPDVARMVTERTGQKTLWDRGPPEDSLLARRVSELLQSDLTEAAAVQIALSNNPSLQATYEELGIAQADLLQAGLLRNPSLDFSVRFPEGSAGLVNTELSIFENLLNIFLLPARKKLATQQFERAKQRLANEIFQVVGKVRQEFYAFQALQQLGHLRRTVLKATEVSAQLAERQHQALNIGDLEFETQWGLYQQAKLDLVRDELRLQVQQEQINRLLGLWGEQTRWKVLGELPEIPREEFPLEQLESAALSRRLDVASARTETEILRQALDLAKTSRFVGTLDVGISRGTGPEPGIRVIGPAVRLELPIFDQRQAMTHRLEAQLRQSEKRFTGLSIEVRSEVRSARIALISARQVVEQYRESLLPNRERVVALSQQRYNAMQLGVFQVLLAKQAQVEAYRQYIEAVRDYWIARVELDRSAGGSVPIPSSKPAGSPAKTEESSI